METITSGRLHFVSWPKESVSLFLSWSLRVNLCYSSRIQTLVDFNLLIENLCLTLC